MSDIGMTISIVKGKAVYHLNCGCNSKKFDLEYNAEDEEYEMSDEDSEELLVFLNDHRKICWSRKKK